MVTFTSAQDPRLTLLGAGFRGDPQAQDGVHLRWAFDPDLGFPPDGFRLFLRTATAAPQVQVSLTALASEVSQQPAPAAVTQGVTIHRADGDLLPVVFRCDRVAFDLGPVPLVLRFRPTFAVRGRVVREVTLTVVTRGGDAMSRALHSGRVAACAATVATAEECVPSEITLRADAIDEVHVTGHDTSLLAVSWRTIADNECDIGWRPLTGPVILPIDPTSARDLALSRLPKKEDLPPGAPTGEELEARLLGPAFENLRASLERAVVGGGQFIEDVEADDPDDQSSWRHDVVRDALTAAADPYFARILGLYWVHRPENPNAVFDYKVEAEWRIGGEQHRFCWMAFSLGMQPQPALPVPTAVVASAQPGAAHVASDESFNPCEMDVVVGWQRPASCQRTDPVRSPIAYLVERTDVDGPSGGPYHALKRSFEEGAEPEVVPALIADADDGREGFASGYYLDRGPGYGTFHYRVRGLDLFGRTSGPSAPGRVEVRDEVPPGPPLNLAADYADPADPDRAASALLAWANRDVPTGAPASAAVAVEWVWPASRQRQSPDLDEFRLYYRAGPLNQVLGRVTAVTPAGSGRFDVVTDIAPVGPDVPLEQDAVDLGGLRSEGEEYPVLTLRTVAGRLTFGVRGSAAAPPLVGPCTFRIGGGTTPAVNQPARTPYPAFRSYELPGDWGGLVLDPSVPESPLPLRIGTDGSLRAPLPPGLAGADVTALRVVEPDGVEEHWHYQLRVRAIRLVTTAERPRATGTFGISACDIAGNEGRVAPPAAIVAVHRAPPVTPPLVYPPVNLATAADYHDQSWFTLAWTGAAGVGYLVYRAVDADLLAAAGVDLATHRARSPDEQRLELQTLGRQTALVPAFRLVTPAPLPAAGGAMSYRDPLPGSVLNRFVYRVRAVDGAGNPSPWPPASEATCVVVDLPGLPPVAPAWSGVGRTEHGVALRWTPDAGSPSTRYRLYRTHDAEAAEDVRSMTPVFAAAQREGGAAVKAVLVERDGTGAELGVVEVPAGERPPGRLLQFVDGVVEDGQPRYYRLVAEDDQNRRSLASDVLTVQVMKRTRPAEPVWGAPAVIAGSVVLSWSAEDGENQALLVRRSDGGIWRALRPWAAAGDDGFTDTDVVAGVTYEYRVRLRDAVGHIVDGPVLTVEAV